MKLFVLEFKPSLNMISKTQLPIRQMNQPCYPTQRSCVQILCEMFGMQLYKNDAHALLLDIFGIISSDWLQHAYSVRSYNNSKAA